MFNDELFNIDPIVDDEQFAFIIKNCSEETGEPIDAKAAEKIYEYMEELELKNILMQMVLEGYIIMSWDESQNKILYSNSKKGQELAEAHFKSLDKQAIENLLKDVTKNN